MKNLVRAFAIVVLLCGFAWMPAPLRGVATAQKRSDAPSRDKDKAKSKQEELGREKDQSIHIFEIPGRS